MLSALTLASVVVTAFFAASHILIVAGKGGVGKTTVGASLGVASARNGLDTLLVELDGHSTLGRSFGHDLLPYDDLDLTDDDPDNDNDTALGVVVK